jgi:flagellin-like protein
MKLNQKRGVSDVVTTVLMILLVIAAIGILWAVISKFVSQGTSTVAGTPDCLTTGLSVDSATNASGLTVKVTRSGTNSGNLTALKFFVDGASVTMNGNIPAVGETQQFVSAGTLPNSLTALTVVGKPVKVAAMIDTKTCDASDSVNVAKQ